MCTNTVNTIVKFLSFRHVSAVTSPSSGCVTHHATGIVSYFNVFYIAPCVTHCDDSDVIAEICRRDRNVTLLSTVFAYYVVFLNITNCVTQNHASITRNCFLRLSFDFFTV
jgi:hypothetical protein